MNTTATMTKPMTDLLDRIAQRERLAQDEWLRVINEAATEDLRRLADDLRREYHPGRCSDLCG
jgi:2-iminoacetate synthase ThiH